MKDKIKAIFDSKMTWATLGTAAGALFGDQVALIVSALGGLVMAVL